MASGRNARVAHTCLLIVAFLVVVYLLIGWVHSLKFRNLYRKGSEPGFDRKEFTLDISEEGIQAADAATEEWSHFSKYSESNNASSSIGTIPFTPFFPNELSTRME
jgi:hypothetical protein